MHRPALTRTQGWAIRRGAGSRSLKNRLSRHRTSRCGARDGTGGCSGRTGGRCWPERRFVNRTRSGLRHNHSWRRRLRRSRRGGPGNHGWRLRWRDGFGWCRRRWCRSSGNVCNRCCGLRCWRLCSRRRWRGCRLRRYCGRRNRKCWARGRSRHDQPRRSRRRGTRWPWRCAQGWRGRYSRRLRLDRRRRNWMCGDAGSLLLADDGL